MNNKIGIITIRSDNFGNRLQNYAVYRTLKDLNMNPVTFNRKYYNTVNRRKKLFLAKILRVFVPLIHMKVIPKKIAIAISKATRISNMNEFTKKYIPLESCCIEKIDKKRIKEYDFFLTGSDQVWNPMFKMTSDADFLAFSPKEKNIAISASLGIDYLSEEQQNKYKNYLTNFKAISVREDKAKDILQPICPIDIKVLADPTIAINAEEWVRLERKVKLPDRYIVVYFLGKYDKKKLLDNIKKLYPNKQPYTVYLADKEYFESYYWGPSEFLYALHHAERVITDSFHGSVFSLIFHKKLTIFLRKGDGYSMNSRIVGLLNRFNLNDKLDNADSTDIIRLDDINYDLIDKIMREEKRRFIEFLKLSMQ